MNTSAFDLPLSRREMLRRCGAGFGWLGLAAVLGQENARAAETHPLAPKPPHFPPRARHVIQILANGGPGHMDTFDPKPALTKYHGQRLPLHFATERPTGTALGSPFQFARYGQCGMEVSELFAPLAEKHADDLCVIRSMHTDTPTHENSLRLMNCGAAVMARPSIGAWITYGLGTENQNLPGFLVLVPKGMPVAGADNWQSSFLPGSYQGTYLETQDRKPSELIEHLHCAGLAPGEQRAQFDFLGRLNRLHLAGGGVEGGTVYGATDEFGFRAIEDRVHIHDLHATVLHQLGLDHERLTYRHSGRDFRLTDVEGRVVKELLA